MHDLGHALESAGHLTDALPLFEQSLERTKATLGPEHRQTSNWMTCLALIYESLGRLAEAELLLRECVMIREKKLPDHWSLFNTKSMLGGALAGQKKFAEAEPLLIEGYSGMKDREAQIPPAAKPRLVEAVRRLVDLYTAWDKPAEAKKWQAILEESPSNPQALPAKGMKE